MMMEWEEKYLLNIQEIDNQHSGFFALIRAGLQHNPANEKQKVTEVINQLEGYLQDHFYAEEKILEDAGYPDIESHKAQHAYFIEKVASMKMDLDYNNPLIYEKFIDFMKKWFLSHILIMDKKYKESVIKYLQSTNNEK